MNALPQIPPHPPGLSELVARPDSRPMEDADDFLVNSERDGSKRIHNASIDAVQLKSVILSGRLLIFEADPTESKPFSLVHGRWDLEAVELNADTIIVRNPLRMPGASVRINARHLRFEKNGLIDTTPYDTWTAPSAVDDTHERPGESHNGQDGGDLVIFVESLEIPVLTGKTAGSGDTSIHVDPVQIIKTDTDTLSLKNAPVRFIANGGRGQFPGDGRDGVDGLSLDVVGVIDGRPAVLIVQSGTLGMEKWPGDGIPPIADGKPGNGGNGGKITTNIPALLEICNAKGGRKGAQGDLRNEALPGNPVHSYHFWYQGHARAHGRDGNISTYFTLARVEEHVSKGYPAAAPPEADRDGLEGTTLIDTEGGARWLSPKALQQTIVYAKALYLAGYFDDALRVLKSYDVAFAAVDSINRLAPESTKLDGQWADIQSMLHRLQGHLDYFGNPPGFVPLLSLEYNLASYKSEIDFAIPTLYSIQWLRQKEEGIENRKAALQLLGHKLEQEIGTDTRTFNSLQGLVAELQNRAITLIQERELLEVQLAERRNALIKLAEADVQAAHSLPAWKQGLFVLATLCKVIPVYQPGLAAVGAGLTALSSAGDSDTTTLALKSAADISDVLGSNDLKKSAESFRKGFASYDPTDYESTRRFAKAVAPTAKQIAKAQKDLRSAGELTQAPRSEVEATFQQLASQDAQFGALTKAVHDHSDKLAQLNEDADQITQRISSLSTEIYADTLTLIAIRQALNEILAVEDDALDAYLQDVKVRAQDRLLKYHYYVAKSYEYRTLQPYPGSIKMDTLFDRLVRLASLDVSKDPHSVRVARALIGPDDYKRLSFVYETPIRDITSTILETYNNNAAEQSSHVNYTLTSEELDILNNTGLLTINIAQRGLLREGEAAQRITEVSCDLEADGGLSGTTLEVRFSHPKRSEIQFEGRSYVFQHPSEFRWTTAFDLDTKQITNDKPSRATESLLKQLAGPIGNSPSLELFSAPSLLGEITLVTIITPRTSNKIILRKVVVHLAYDYRIVK
jgi:hypothetical protein